MSDAKELSGDDRAAIENLYARYIHCADEGNFDGFADCFTQDGAIHLIPLDVSIEGREALHGLQKQSKAALGDKQRRHWNSSLYLEQDSADTVRGRVYFRSFNGAPGEMPVLSDTGVYEDRIVRTGGRWLFAERRILIEASTRK